ncbi:MAG: hypothetical protein PHH41_08885 [Sulfurimonas sp.]|jgi:hypothetical protein|nr:hypothetical protein [Sulfurimonas sp.]MDD5203241.1 hypothetical protein [Sulfurimonas sp.]
MALFLALNAEAIESETTYENSNFTLSAPLNATEERTLYNTNRFRLTSNFREGNWFATVIGDLKNTIGYDTLNSSSYKALRNQRADTPFYTKTDAADYTEGELFGELYRFYAGYADQKNRLSIGLQKVSMGVGRIWNPTDLFNPKNPLALEPDEVYGVFALSYTYSPSDLSQITAVAAQRADNSIKYAGRAKGYFGFADAAIDVVSGDDASMIGYELEGELFQSGIELRSEGGWFEDKVLKETFFQGLIGADYAFENSFTLAGEWLHSSKTFAKELRSYLSSGTPQNLVSSHDYVGFSGGYEFNALLNGSLTSIINMEDKSYFLSPSIHYSLADDIALGLGSMFYIGKSGSEFGDYGILSI